METRPLVRADFVTGVFLIVFGLAVLAEAWSMPRLEERSINPWTAPGIVPGILGIIIALCGALLALRSVGAGALRARWSGVADADSRDSFWRLTLCALLCVGYAVLLVGQMPFWLATAVFVFAFVAAFEWNGSDTGPARGRKLVVAAAIAAATAIIIPYSFQYLFLVRLP
jgi:putative tricarboxylic transport membrane protein